MRRGPFFQQDGAAMIDLLRRFIANRNGATAVEYALIATLLSVVVAAAITALGGRLFTLIGTATNAVLIH
jgi:pilus assembly protein Flp/PilA